jgi:hypothetical protein
LNGEALGELEYLASGGSLDALMRSLSGKGWLEVSKGFFTGFDLEKLMRSGQGNGGSTVFDQLSGSYTIEKGNLVNQDLLMTLKGIRAEGTGRIGLGAQDLDYRFTPTISGINGAAGLTIPVLITGPWADPKIRPDLKNALQPEIDAVEQEAKDRVIEKLSEELDMDPGTGSQPGDPRSYRARGQGSVAAIAAEGLRTAWLRPDFTPPVWGYPCHIGSPRGARQVCGGRGARLLAWWFPPLAIFISLWFPYLNGLASRRDRFEREKGPPLGGPGSPAARQGKPFGFVEKRPSLRSSGRSRPPGVRCG